MSGPIKRLFDATHARWTELGYAWPLKYGQREAYRQDLDPVALHGGRVVMHAGLPGEEGDAGELDATILQAYDTAQSIATDWSTFTVHCHGYDASAPDNELLQDDAAWLLKQAFFGAFQFSLPAPLGHYMRLVSQVWVRNPQERRFGELIRLVVQVSFAIRQAPGYPVQTAVPVPKTSVVTPGGPVVIVEGGNL